MKSLFWLVVGPIRAGLLFANGSYGRIRAIWCGHMPQAYRALDVQHRSRPDMMGAAVRAIGRQSHVQPKAAGKLSLADALVRESGGDGRRQDSVIILEPYRICKHIYVVSRGNDTASR